MEGLGQLKNPMTSYEVDKKYFVGFEVPTAVVMKSVIFWDIASCGPFKVNRRFGGTYRFHLQFRGLSRAR
jgi:hypothetical protein